MFNVKVSILIFKTDNPLKLKTAFQAFSDPNGHHCHSDRNTIFSFSCIQHLATWRLPLQHFHGFLAIFKKLSVSLSESWSVICSEMHLVSLLVF